MSPFFTHDWPDRSLPSIVTLQVNLFEKIRWHGGKYIIRFNQLGNRDEIIQWIRDNIPNTYMTKDPTRLDLVRFKNKEDFMAFKLRWL